MMRITIRFIAVGVLTALLYAVNVFAQGNSFEIRGDVQKPRAWTVDDVKKQFAEEIRTMKSTFEPEKEERLSTGIPRVTLVDGHKLAGSLK